MENDIIEVVLDDDDEYMYKKPDESEDDFETRMDILGRKLDERMTEEEKQRVEELLSNMVGQTV